MSHEWTVKFIEHRVGDPRIVRLIQKWLKAGVSEEGQWSETKVGTFLWTALELPLPGSASWMVGSHFEARVFTRSSADVAQQRLSVSSLPRGPNHYDASPRDSTEEDREGTDRVPGHTCCFVDGERHLGHLMQLEHWGAAEQVAPLTQWLCAPDGPVAKSEAGGHSCGFYGFCGLTMSMLPLKTAPSATLNFDVLISPTNLQPFSR